jgi:hypothetical protein
LAGEPAYQLFYGERPFCHKLPFDRSSLTNWRQRLGEKQVRLVVSVRTAAGPKHTASPAGFPGWVRRLREKSAMLAASFAKQFPAGISSAQSEIEPRPLFTSRGSAVAFTNLPTRRSARSSW